ncbi:MAG: Cof-type HAD-IIB family hydrolase [Candidatus Izimaplasma sp.]|nr:Cof-type HAD-IIB family hydrolase [Candidatus Izimaplasma bacterium]
MKKKFIFVDMDGTLVNHNTNTIPKSTKEAIKRAKENGHELILTTGRPPCLFYGIDETLGFDSYIGANGRIVVSHGKVIYEDHIDPEVIERLLEMTDKNSLDLGFEGMHHFAVNSTNNDLYKKFCKNFNIDTYIIEKDYYKKHLIYQLILFYDKPDFKKFEIDFPELTFNYSCEFGLDVNSKGGLKERGIKEFVNYYDLNHNDIIAIGDGYNDISMIEYANTGIAMGNAPQEVKEHADIVADSIDEDGLFNVLEKIGII